MDDEWVGAYIKWVLEHPRDEAVTLELGLWIFQEITASDHEQHPELLALGAVEVVSLVTDRAAAFPEAQVWGCAALWHLASTAEGEAALLASNAVETVLVCANRAPKSAELMVFSMGALSALCCSTAGQGKLAEADAHKLVLQCLKSEEHAANAEIRRWACAVVAFMVDAHKENAVLLAKDDRALSCVVDCLEESLEGLNRRKGGANRKKSRAVEDPLVAAAACLALDRMFDALPELRAEFQKGDGATGKLKDTRLKKLLACMTLHVNNHDVQEFGCSALRSLSDGSSSAARGTEIKAMVASGVPAVVQASMASFSADWTIDAHGKRIQAALSTGYFGWVFMYSKAVFSDVMMHRSRAALVDRLISEPPRGPGTIVDDV